MLILSFSRAKRAFFSENYEYGTRQSRQLSIEEVSGYNEIEEPRRKNILIDYERLRELFGVGSYGELRNSHRGWIEEYLGSGSEIRRDEWTGSIAIGSRSFVENVKTLLGLRAKGRRVMEILADINSGRKLFTISLFSGRKRTI